MKEKPQAFQPSTTTQPDRDWSQARETVTMLKLAVAQISGARQEGDESVKALTDAFTAMMEDTAAIQAANRELPADSPRREDIDRHCAAISREMQTAIVAFQFYDRLDQRLRHLTTSLTALGELVGNPGQLCNPQAWKRLQAGIKSRYTMESDKAIFDAILKGATVTEALEHSRSRQVEKADDIELF